MKRRGSLSRPARKLKVDYPGAILHVMNRGDQREPIFKDAADRQRFVETMPGAKTGDELQPRIRLPQPSLKRRAERKQPPALNLVLDFDAGFLTSWQYANLPLHNPDGRVPRQRDLAGQRWSSVGR